MFLTGLHNQFNGSALLKASGVSHIDFKNAAGTPTKARGFYIRVDDVAGSQLTDKINIQPRPLQNTIASPETEVDATKFFIDIGAVMSPPFEGSVGQIRLYNPNATVGALRAYIYALSDEDISGTTFTVT